MNNSNQNSIKTIESNVENQNTPDDIKQLEEYRLRYIKKRRLKFIRLTINININIYRQILRNLKSIKL